MIRLFGSGATFESVNELEQKAGNWRLEGGSTISVLQVVGSLRRSNDLRLSPSVAHRYAPTPTQDGHSNPLVATQFND